MQDSIHRVRIIVKILIPKAIAIFKVWLYLHSSLTQAFPFYCAWMQSILVRALPYGIRCLFVFIPGAICVNWPIPFQCDVVLGVSSVQEPRELRSTFAGKLTSTYSYKNSIGLFDVLAHQFKQRRSGAELLGEVGHRRRKAAYLQLLFKYAFLIGLESLILCKRLRAAFEDKKCAGKHLARPGYRAHLYLIELEH